VCIGISFVKVWPQTRPDQFVVVWTFPSLKWTNQPKKKKTAEEGAVQQILIIKKLVEQAVHTVINCNTDLVVKYLFVWHMQ